MSNIHILTADVVQLLSNAKITFSQWVATDIPKKLLCSRTKSNGRYQRDQESPHHIIGRFVVRKERDLVWENRDKIKNPPRFKDNESFLVPDLAKELPEASFILRQAVRIARERELRVGIKRNKLVMLDSGLSYPASEYLSICVQRNKK